MADPAEKTEPGGGMPSLQRMARRGSLTMQLLSFARHLFDAEERPPTPEEWRLAARHLVKEASWEFDDESLEKCSEKASAVFDAEIESSYRNLHHVVDVAHEMEAIGKGSKEIRASLERLGRSLRGERDGMG